MPRVLDATHLGPATQMHTPTHSHISSKNGFSIQSCYRKQHIPPRIKDQRFKSHPISCQMPMVVHRVEEYDENHQHNMGCFNSVQDYPHDSWFDPHENKCKRTHSKLHDNDLGKKITHNLLHKVKAYRTTHWADCHAHSLSSERLIHECGQHYMLNKRLYLEPLHSGLRECKGIHIDPFSKTVIQSTMHTSCIKSPPEGDDDLLIVTLPRLLLDESVPSAHILSQHFRQRGSFSKQNPNSLRGVSLPSDSYALSDQICEEADKVK